MGQMSWSRWTLGAGLGLAALLGVAEGAIERDGRSNLRLVVSAAHAQGTANDSAEKEAFEASKALGTIEAWQAYLKNFPTGFRADLARAYLAKLSGTGAATPAAAAPTPLAAPVSPSPAPAGHETVRLATTPIRVGKWPERVTYDGRGSLWVSESGARSIVEIGLRNRAVLRRLPVGRLPVDIVGTENGTIYTLAETDNVIHAVAPGTGDKAAPFADVPRCADTMTYAANVLWVTSNIDCSQPAVLTRVSHLNGRTAKVANLQAGPVDIKAAHGFVYIAHMGVAGRPAFLTLVDAQSGAAQPSPGLPIHYPRLAITASAVYAGGAPANQGTGLVLKMGIGLQGYGQSPQLPEPIAAIAASDQYVVAAGGNGTLFVLAAADLALVRTIATDARLQPRDVLALGNTLVVVSSGGNDVASDNVVHLIDGWMPGVAASAFVPPPVSSRPAEPQAAAPRVTKAAPPLICGENYKKVRGECVPVQNCGAHAYRNAEGDCDCDSGFSMRDGRCVAKAAALKCGENYKKVRGECVLMQNCGPNATRSPEGDCYCNSGFAMQNGKCVAKGSKQPVRDTCPGDSVLKNGRCVKEAEPDFKPPIKCTGGQLYSLSQKRCVCQDGLKWNGQRCYLP